MKRISLEGNLAAGKSTLLNVLELLDESCEIAPEPVTQWQHVEDSAKIEDSTSHSTRIESPDDMNILKQYYKDPYRWAHTFYMYAFSSRLRHYRWVPHKEITKYLFMERSMESDKHIFAKNCFVYGYMNKLEYTIYQDLHAYWTEQAPRLDAIVYLKTSADICHERLVRRNRGEESTVSLEYLESIEARHEEWIGDKAAVKPSIPIFVIDNSLPLTPERQLEIRESLQAFLHSLE